MEFTCFGCCLATNFNTGPEPYPPGWGVIKLLYAMRRTIFIALLACWGHAFALSIECPEFIAPGGEHMTIVKDANVVLFSVPATLEGNPLVSIWFLAENDSGQLEGRIAFTLEGDRAKGFLSVYPDWIDLKFEARYSNEFCGPRLNGQVGI